MEEAPRYERLRRWLYLALLLAFVFAPVLYFWARGEPSEPVGELETRRSREPSEAAPADAMLQGTEAPRAGTEAPAAELENESRTDRSPRVLRGVVRSAEGTELEGADVFILRKDEGESWQTLTAGDGRFDLRLKDARGAWIGAALEGYLPAYRDGDDLSPEGEIELEFELEPGPVVRVRVSDGRRGALALDTTIFVTSEIDAALPPALGVALRIQREVVVPAGEHEVGFCVGTRARIHLEAVYGNVRPIVEPQEVLLEPPGEAVFTVRPSCGLDIEVVDAATGQPLDRGFHYSLLQDGKLVTGGALRLPGGRMQMAYRLKPGRYEIEVWALGYRRRAGPGIELADYGEEAEVSVRLEPDPTLGHLRVSIPALGRLPRLENQDGTTYPPPARLLWRRAGGGTWGPLGGASRRETDADYLFTYVPEGEVDLLVAEEVSNLAAFAQGIRIRALETETVVVDLYPGIRFEASESWPADRQPEAFEVRHPTYGVLPVWSLTSSTMYVQEQPGSVPGTGLQIGPYPGPEIEVVSTFAGGEAVRRTLHAEED